MNNRINLQNLALERQSRAEVSATIKRLKDKHLSQLFTAGVLDKIYHTRIGPISDDGGIQLEEVQWVTDDDNEFSISQNIWHLMSEHAFFPGFTTTMTSSRTNTKGNITMCH